MPDTYLSYPALHDLPRWVRKQRRLESKIAPLEPLAVQEKALRKDIDALLATAGLQRNDMVTCVGYDVTRRGQKGRESINQDTLVELLVAAGLERAKALTAIAGSIDTGDPSTWSEIKPSKGAKVRK